MALSEQQQVRLDQLREKFMAVYQAIGNGINLADKIQERANDEDLNLTATQKTALLTKLTAIIDEIVKVTDDLKAIK